MAPGARVLRRVEVAGALSLATDLGMGQPLEYGLRAAVVAGRLARQLGADETTAEDAFSLSLLRFIGCTADSRTQASYYGDEIRAGAAITPLFYGRPAEVFGTMLRHVAASESPARRALGTVRFVATASRRLGRGAVAHCEVASMLAGRLGFPARTTDLLGHIFERWDGKGMPGRKADEIALAARVMHVARDAAAYHHREGVDGAVAVVRARAAHGYDPDVAEAFCDHAAELVAGLDESSVWGLGLEEEPGDRPPLEGEALDAALEAVADFVDLKSVYTPGHSRAVASLAAEAGRHVGLPADEVTDLRRAGLLHDLGRVATSVSVWEKPGPLTFAEREQVRLHPYCTERVLAPAPGLDAPARLASLHHERLDGSGYHHRSEAAVLTPAARVLAAADAFAAMTEPRPHRPAHTTAEAAKLLRGEVRAGRIDGPAADAVLQQAGAAVARKKRTQVAGLSEREIEVLRLVARGMSTKAIAAALGITPKTADHHIQHIYTKAGVTTRAAATVFAMRHHLVPNPSGGLPMPSR